MKHWLKLIRPLNLLLLAITQYCIDIFILQPNFNKYGLHFTLSEWQFALLVLATLLICAGGYIINDYFDVEIDAVNKPDKQIVGKFIAPKKAFNAYLMLSFLGLAIGAYLSFAIHFQNMITIFVIIIVLLYLYSTTFKGIAFLGNFIVSLFAAMSIIIVVLFEPSLYRLGRPGDYYIANLCIQFVNWIALFAFSLTMVREIVKDIQDIEGDKKHGGKTIPVIWGKRNAAFIGSFFLLLTTVALLVLNFSVLNTFGEFYLYYIIALAVFNVFIGYKLLSAATKNDFGFVSTLLKLAMLAGIVIMPLYFILEF